MRKAASVVPTNASAKRFALGHPPAVRVREPERREQQPGELRPARERDRRAARPGGGGEPEAPDQERGHDRVVRVRVRGVERERIRRPRERERRAEPRPAEAPPDEREPDQAERVEEERGRMRGPELVPLPGPAEDRVAGQVGQVRHRPVGVAARVGGLAAPVGLDPLADLPLRVGAAARLQAPLLGHVPVGHLPVRDPLRADDSGEADVDDAALGLHVQADPEAAEEDGGARQQPDRPDRRRGPRRAVPARDPDTPSEQVEQRRIGERSAPEDLALVEEAKRDREREQGEEVEVAQRERAPQVGEADEEGRAEARARATSR